MRLFGRGSKHSLPDEEPPEEPAEPPDQAPPGSSVWLPNANEQVYYCVREPWVWVMNSLRHEKMKQLEKPADLPSNVAAARAAANGETSAVTPRTGRRLRNQQKQKPTAILKVEVCDTASGNVLFAAHGVSAALEGLEDKDELVRTMQRCRCEEKHITPPSILINWDITHEECLNVLGDQIPVVKENRSRDVFVVLKEPMGSQGQGVFFVKTAEEIYDIIHAHRQQTQEQDDFLNKLIEQKGRIPSWVVQAEVVPSILVRGNRKFHIRSYVLIVEHLESKDFWTYVYNRHEIRVAGVPVSTDGKDRDRKAYITNGALSRGTERLLLSDVEELLDRGLQERLELFIAKTFGKYLTIDIARRIGANMDSTQNSVRKFAVAGLDLMVTGDNRIYLLEVNANPAAPKEESVTDKFKDHLKGFMRDLASTVAGKESPNFLHVNDVMDRHGVKY